MEDAECLIKKITIIINQGENYKNSCRDLELLAMMPI